VGTGVNLQVGDWGRVRITGAKGYYLRADRV
jgi:hypothetical protein